MFNKILEFFGWLVAVINQGISQIGTEPEHISYFAFTIIVMGILSKLITIPMTRSMTKSQEQMKKLQPELDALEKKYGYDQMIYQQKMQEFYKENNISTSGLTGCLSLLINMVIMIALFNVLRDPAQYMAGSAEEFAAIKKHFFWIKDLTQPDPLKYFGLPLVNAILQLVSQLVNPSLRNQQDMPGGQSSQMFSYLMVVMVYIWGLSWASALLLYWTTQNLCQVIYQLIVNYKLNKKYGEDKETGKKQEKKDKKA